jgi:hypothetical protein
LRITGFVVSNTIINNHLINQVLSQKVRRYTKTVNI